MHFSKVTLTSHTLIIILIGFFTFSAGAMESRYLINQPQNKSTISINAFQGKQNYYYNSDIEARVGSADEFGILTESKQLGMRLDYSRMLSETLYGSIGTTFLKRNVSSLDTDQGETMGIGNLELMIKKGLVKDSYTFIYGSEFSLSPDNAKDPRVENSEFRKAKFNGNNATGYHLISPFVGWESYVDSTAVGLQVNLEYAVTPKKDNRFLAAQSKLVPFISGNLEFPIAPKFHLGINAGFSQDMLINQTSKSASALYGIFSYEKGFDFNGQVQTMETTYPYELTDTKISLGITKTL